MSLVSLLSIARTALLTQQRAMTVTGHNVANANTPGYTRQVLDIHAAAPLWTPNGTLGLGVDSGSVMRMRDSFLDTAFRRANAQLGSADTRQQTLTAIQNAVNEPSDSGVSAAMDAYFKSWGDLASNPSDRTLRNLVLDKAGVLVSRIHALGGSLAQSASDAHTQMVTQVGQVNDLVRRIGDLDAQIRAAGGAEGSAPDLEDQRDQLLDQLSNQVPTQVIHRDDGTIAVAVGDTLLVDGANVRALDVRAAAGGGFTVGVTGDPSPIDLAGGGALGATVELSTVTLPGLQSQLDTFVSALVGEVNGVHGAGYTPSGATGVAFFDPAGVTATTLAISGSVAGKPDQLAASAAANGADGDVALRLAGLGDKPVTALGGRTLRDAYSDFVGDVATETQRAGLDADAAQTLTDNADAQRQSANGVSVDEEMTTLIAQQQAYQAAARLVQTASDMVDVVMKMVGA